MTYDDILKQATPRPWGFEEEDCDGHYEPAMVFGAFETPKPNIVCEMAARPNSDTNGELIVLAVNSHEALKAENEQKRKTIEALVEALEELQSALLAYDGHASFPNDISGWTESSGHAAYQKADAALALAKGGK